MADTDTLVSRTPGISTLPQKGRIDTHHHILPPRYAAWLHRHGITDGDRPMPEWSMAGALDLMNDNHIGATILSVSTPGVCLGARSEQVSMAREVNEFAAGQVAERPGQFGFFATLPLPSVDDALREIEHAFDLLHADGVILLGNASGIYPGDRRWDPVMEELNRRKAVIFIHPSALPGEEVPGIPAYAADFLLDTTRAAISIAKSGCLERYPDLKFILSHGGGFLPYAAQRFAQVCSPDKTSDGGIRRLRQFYFDVALSSTPYSLPSLLSFADPQKILFGSDWPFAAKESSRFYRELLEDYPLSARQRQAIDRDNAAALFPRFALERPA